MKLIENKNKENKYNQLLNSLDYLEELPVVANWVYKEIDKIEKPLYKKAKTIIENLLNIFKENDNKIILAIDIDKITYSLDMYSLEGIPIEKLTIKGLQGFINYLVENLNPISFGKE